MGATGASGSWLETIRKSAKQAISVHFGAISGLIVPFFALNRAENEKTLGITRIDRTRQGVGALAPATCEPGHGVLGLGFGAGVVLGEQTLEHVAAGGGADGVADAIVFRESLDLVEVVF